MPDQHRELLSRLIGYVFFPLEDPLHPESQRAKDLHAIKWAMHDLMENGAYDDFGRQFSLWARELYPTR